MKPVRFNQTAVSQADEIELWWRRNRRSAPNLFRDELAEAIQLLGDNPDIGVIAEDVPVAGTRTITLRKTNYVVYYRVLDHEVRITSVWHGKRGQAPDEDDLARDPESAYRSAARRKDLASRVRAGDLPVPSPAPRAKTRCRSR